ncbi:MAG TPA: c-type cytochrome biogenesis protein CcmI, partial [Gammaproteobacteria bacterium]|nr:c-type cytochrome biogenesis protein CcmI [Gammaproteobacteria bacterium]
MVFVFWLIAGLLIAAALLFVLPPLLGRADTAGPNQNEINRALYQQRLAELERDVENDVLTPAQFERARADLDRELLSDWTDTPARPSLSPRTYWAAWIVGIALPILAVGIYARLNTGLKMLSGEANSMVSAGDEQPPLEKMEELIEARLAQKPNDRTGWIMLARVDTLLGRYAAASRAYARADNLATFKDARLLAAYAQTLAFTNGQQFAGRPTMLLNKALKLQPENPQALWLAGWAAFQRKDFDQAAELWEKLDTLMPAEHRQVFKKLPQAIAQAKRLSGISSAELNKNMPAPSGSRKVGATSAKAKAASPALLHVSVQLVPKLMDRAAS